MKIVIIGDSGAGKSTLARKISEKNGIPVFHQDTVWLKTLSKEAVRESTQSFLSQNKGSWIIDGNYRDSIELKLPQADFVLWLQISPLKALYRVIIRSIKRRMGKRKPDIPEDFTEKFDKEWLEFLNYVWHSPKRNKISLSEKIDEFDKWNQTYVIRNKKDKDNAIKIIHTAYYFDKNKKRWSA